MRISGVVLASMLLMPVIAIAGQGDTEQFRDQARTTTDRLATELMQALQAAMQEGGPPQAISVCRDQAPAIKSRLSLERGWRISRVGTRVRNPLLGMPDAWERTVLDEFEQLQADGVAFSDMEKIETVTESGQRFHRYMRPIPVQAQCLACHGQREDMPESIRKTLDERYPHDQAHDYQSGELRGAFSIKAPAD